MNPPIFFFSAGWRSGSPMVQRVITATGCALVWGKAGGALDRIADTYACYEQILGPGGQRFKHGFGGNGAAELEAFKAAGDEGVKKWIACMNPPMPTLLASFRAFLKDLYARAASELGYRGWGIKEVQSGIEAARSLRTLYPDARFVFLVRHPVACVTSIKRRNWLDHPDDPGALKFYAGHWARLAGEFRQSAFGKLVKHEDHVSSAAAQEKLGAYLGYDELRGRFGEVNHADWQSFHDEALTFVEKRRLLRIVQGETRHYGYD